MYDLFAGSSKFIENGKYKGNYHRGKYFYEFEDYIDSIHKSNNDSTLFLNPEIRVYNQPSIQTSEADIKSNIFTDNYLVFNILKDDGYFNVRYQFKPLMLYIWVSIFFVKVINFFSSFIISYCNM